MAKFCNHKKGKEMNSVKKFQWIFLSFILFSAVMITIVGCQEKVEVSKSKALYQCSMHPSIISNKPEKCPICGMKLTRVENASKISETLRQAQGERKILFYRNPMNPTVTSPVPAKDELGMNYI